MHPPPKLVLDHSNLGLHPFARCLAPELEALAVLGPPTDVGEAEKVERFRLAVAAPCSVGGRILAERDQARLRRVQFERKLRQPLPRIGEEAFGVGTVLDELDQPVVADRVETLRDIGVEDPVDVACLVADRERVQAIVLSAPS